MLFGGAINAIKEDKAYLPLVVYPFVYIYAFSLSNVPLLFWYFSPVLPFYLLLLVLGGDFYLRLLFDWLQTKLSPISLRPYRVGLGALLLGLAFLAFARECVYIGSCFPRDRESLYQSIACGLNCECTSETVLAAPEIGTLGYFFKGKILDTEGLVSPQAVRFRDPDLYPNNILPKISPLLIEKEEPDYIVTLDAFLTGPPNAVSLLECEFFLKHYEVQAKFPVSSFDSKYILVYRRTS